MALALQIIGLVSTNAPILLGLIQKLVDNAHQNKEMTDEEHATLIAAIQHRAVTDPAWRPSPDYKG